MNISVEITGNLLKYLDSKVISGTFKSRSEVVRTAIREMIQRDLEDMLRQKGITPEVLSTLRDEVVGEVLAKKHRELA